MSDEGEKLARLEVLCSNAYAHGYLRIKSARTIKDDPEIMVHTLQVNFCGVWINLICMQEFTGTILEPIAG